jgi:hypothetical protein
MRRRLWPGRPRLAVSRLQLDSSLVNPKRSRAVGAFVTVVVLVVGACAADDSSDTTDPVSTIVPVDPAVTAVAPEVTTDDEADTSGDEAAPPAEDSGTITIGSETTELGPADFLICETVNPAFDDNINIVVSLDGDPGQVRIAGDLPDDVSAEVGQLPEEVIVDGIDATRGGRTVSVSVDADGTMIEFSFTC